MNTFGNVILFIGIIGLVSGILITIGGFSDLLTQNTWLGPVCIGVFTLALSGLGLSEFKLWKKRIREKAIKIQEKTRYNLINEKSIILKPKPVVATPPVYTSITPALPSSPLPDQPVEVDEAFL